MITFNDSVKSVFHIPWNQASGEKRETYNCPGQRVYSKNIYESTIVSEFDLACENAWQTDTCSSVFYVFKPLAMLVTGLLSDRFGRRPVFLIGIIILVASGISSAFAPNMSAFCVLYVIQGASDSSMFLALYTMGMEYVGPSKRKIAGVFMGVCFGLGHALLAIEAYLLSNWRYLALVASSPGVILIFSWFFLSEPTRWLLARGRHEEAKKIITKVAVVNKVKLEEDTLERLFNEGDEEKQTSTHTPIDLFRTWNRAKFALIMTTCRFILDLTYYGIVLHSEGLGGNIYINFALLGAADVPGLLVAVFIVDRVGRRSIIVVTFCIGGIACIVSGLLPTDLQWLIITMAVIGKMMVSVTGSVMLMLTAEVYPTVVRQSGISLTVSVARLGAAVAPQVLALGRMYSPLPFIILGSLAVGSGLLALLLPETLGKSLPQTIEEWDARLNHGSLKFTVDHESVDRQTGEELKDLSNDSVAVDSKRADGAEGLELGARNVTNI
ncbi:organic cation transporter protein-like [Lingula anatina]|uniref:Organic cation transporter protein-like n=1 Tax=Lingula anatina TaxID=7574 RepID=A0A1S3IPH7_LINAN|nr:organic cation transporter protein-like [Lingula anatina]|eukprot:XP_013400117.1 organic cation transporter protein-like [Lingula anatina]